ncbi:MAG: endolytic transglycosylase MltG [Oscillospiraceae bacterium]|jgi:UPF0755 protein|nr:endolytic transglycosylase MltG [Oscillospiraceae bacterium]
MPDDPEIWRDYFSAGAGGAANSGGGQSRPRDGRDGGDDGADGGDFKINFDFDGEYRDVPEERPLRQRREKRTGCLGGLLFAAFVVSVSLLLAFFGWLAATDVLGLGDADKTVQVTVPREFNMDDVARALRESGLIKYEFLFKIYADFSKADGKISSGTYNLNTNYDYRMLVDSMTERGGKRATVDVTIPEGYTLAQIFKRFDENGVCTEEELWESAANNYFDYDFLKDVPLGDKYRLEGFLFPNSYTFYVGDTPERAISKMLTDFGKHITDDMLAKADALGYSLREILTIASMIEKEAAAADDRPLVSSVIHNRLGSDDFPRLEIDATIYYAAAMTGESFSGDPDVNLDNPYNTRVYPGLPPGPIANPGIDSITAALEPATTDYYFYALGKGAERRHEFFSDYDSFLEFVRSDDFGG